MSFVNLLVLSKSQYAIAFATVRAFWPLAKSVTTPSKIYLESLLVFSSSKLSELPNGDI